MIVSKEPIALIVSRVSREMMPCSNPVLTLSLPCVPTLSPYPVSLPCLPTLCPYPVSLPCVPVPPVPGVQIGMRALRCQGRRGREEQRATLLPLGGKGALRDETKHPSRRLLALLVDRYLRGEVYITSLY